MSKVFVIDTDLRPKSPIHPARATQLLRSQKAAIYRRFPFTLILKKSQPSVPTLFGYETRQYLLEKWHRQCGYCGIKDVPLQIEHILCRAKGGSDSITNMTLSCEKCNRQKGIKDIKDFLKKDPVRLEKILKQAKQPLADAAAVNTTRLALLETLKATNLPIEMGSGGLTKFNRTQQKLPKLHWLDAACVGLSTPILNIKGVRPLLITATGHGIRQMCRTNKYGFPIRHCSRTKFHFGFQTGDTVKAVVLSGKKIGQYVGRVATRATGSFNVSTQNGLVQGISHKYCQRIHAKDGYSYAVQEIWTATPVHSTGEPLRSRLWM